MLVNADFSQPATVAGNEYQWVASPQSGLERLPPEQAVFSKADCAVEVLVIEGQIDTHDQELTRGSWMRLPAGYSVVMTSGVDGATLFIKSGHLPQTLEHPRP